jgi:coenzyme F420 hydrogenase subunit beta
MKQIIPIAKAQDKKLIHVLSIANSDQCSYCGACLGVCPGGETRNLNIESFKLDGWKLKILDEDKCASCTLCIDACPMHIVNYTELDNSIFPEQDSFQFDPNIGFFLESYIAYSTNSQIRGSGASGGMVGEIVSYLFDSKKIDGVLALMPGGAGPLDYKAFIAESFDQFKGSQGSHYFPLPAMDALSSIMNGKYRKVLVIGIPCQILGLQLARRRMQKLKDRIYCVIGSFCGGTTTFKLLDYLASRLPADQQKNIKTVRFRGGHWPGDIFVELNNGEKIKLDGIERDINQFTALLPACLYCSDHFNEYTDISLGDPWLDEILLRGDGGYNVAIARSQKGVDLLHDLQDLNRIKTEFLSTSDLLRSQRGPLDFKKRGLGPRLKLKYFFSSNTPKIYAAKLARSDFLDYFNAFFILMIVRIAKYRMYWRFACFVSSKTLLFINKPFNVLQKRYNLKKRFLKKTLNIVFASNKIQKIIDKFFINIERYGYSGLFSRLLRKIYWRISYLFDNYTFNLDYYCIAIFKYTDKNLSKWLPVKNIEINGDKKNIKALLKELNINWKISKISWNYDSFNNTYFPFFSPLKLDKWIRLQKEPKPDFMVANERSKLNLIISSSLNFRITKKIYFHEETLKEIEDWKKNAPLGSGVSYFTTLNVAQRLINLCIAYVLLNDSKVLKTKLIKIYHIAFLEFKYLKKYNTGFYDVRNNFYICELVAMLTFKKTFHAQDFSAIYSLESALINEVNLQVSKDGLTKEGSLAYSKFICELLFLAVILDVSSSSLRLKELWHHLQLLADKNGYIPPFGDVSCERSFQLNPNEPILDASNLFFLLSRFFDCKTNFKGNRYIKISELLFYGANKKELQEEEKIDSSFVEIPGYIKTTKKWGSLIASLNNISSPGKGTHAHCDQGSYIVSTELGQFITDPGTYSYFESNTLRKKYTSSGFHNCSSPVGFEICLIGPGPFDISNSGKVAKKIHSNNKFSLYLPGYLIENRRFPIKRTFYVEDYGFAVEDIFIDLINVHSFIHFYPGITIDKVISNNCRIIENENLWQFTLESPGRFVVEDYVHSSGYRIANKASRIKISIPNDKNKLRYTINKISKAR